MAAVGKPSSSGKLTYCQWAGKTGCHHSEVVVGGGAAPATDSDKLLTLSAESVHLLD